MFTHLTQRQILWMITAVVIVAAIASFIVVYLVSL